MTYLREHMSGDDVTCKLSIRSRGPETPTLVGFEAIAGKLQGMEKLDISAVIPDPTATSRNFTLALRFASPEYNLPPEKARTLWGTRPLAPAAQ